MLRVRQGEDAIAKLQELKHLLSESEARERSLEMRSLAMSPPTLATPEEKELARTIAQERQEEGRQESLITHLAARPPRQQLQQATSPHQLEESHFMHALEAAAQPAPATATPATLPVRPVTAREAEIAADAVEVAAQTKAQQGVRSTLQEEEPYEEEDEQEQEQPYEEEPEEPEEPAESDEQDEPEGEEDVLPDVGIEHVEAPEGPEEAQPAEVETAQPAENVEQVEPAEGGGAEGAETQEQPGAEEAEDAVVAEPVEGMSPPAQSPANADMAWPPASSPSAPTLPTGHPDMVWPGGQPKGWGPQEDVGWHTAPPSAATGSKAEPVVVAVPVGPAGGAEQASSEGSASIGAEAMAWPVPGYEDPVIKGKRANGELSWPGSKDTINPRPTPPVPATQPSAKQQPEWFHGFVSAVGGSAPSSSPSPPPPPTASASDWFHSIVAPVASIGGFGQESKPKQQRGSTQGDDIAWGRAQESRVARERRKNDFLGRKGIESWEGPGGSDKDMTWPVNNDQPAPAAAPFTRCVDTSCHPVCLSLSISLSVCLPACLCLSLSRCLSVYLSAVSLFLSSLPPLPSSILSACWNVFFRMSSFVFRGFGGSGP